MQTSCAYPRGTDRQTQDVSSLQPERLDSAARAASRFIPMNATTTRCLNPWQSEAGRRAEPTTRHCDYLPETKKRNVGVALGYSGSARQAALQEFSLEDMRETQAGTEVDAVVFKAKCQEAGHPVATG